LSIPSNSIAYLQKYFDKIFVVSVPRFADRHQRVSQQLAGLSFDFFWGADKLKLDAVQQDGTYDEVQAKKLQRQGKPLNLGEIACSLSHRMLYQEMIKNNWKRVLILEDDVVALEQALNELPMALAELPENWELVYLGYLKHEKVGIGLKIKQFFYTILAACGGMKWTLTMVKHLLPKSYSQHLKKAGFHDCTHAYALTLEAAKKLLPLQSPVVYRADDLLSATIMKGNLNAFVTVPKFFDQELFNNPAIVSEIKE
jgi:glycosyl transferase family 25